MAKRRGGPKEWRPPMAMEDVERTIRADCLVIVAHEWFARADFQEWRRRSGVATWDGDDLDGQDVFLVFDEELDWHANGMPRDIDRKIMRLVAASGMEYGTVWIKAV